jgi:hypothetical protein
MGFHFPRGNQEADVVDEYQTRVDDCHVEADMAEVELKALLE